MNTESWVLRKNLAVSTDDAMTTGKEPNCTRISGPWRFASASRERCGSAPRRLKLPITGPGRLLHGRRRLRPETARRNRTVASTTARTDAHAGSSIGENVGDGMTMARVRLARL
jgi:hypothetical protein